MLENCRLFSEFLEIRTPMIYTLGTGKTLEKTGKRPDGPAQKRNKEILKPAETMSEGTQQ